MIKKEMLLAIVGGAFTAFAGPTIAGELLPSDKFCAANGACLLQLQATRASLSDLRAQGYSTVVGPALHEACDSVAGVEVCMTLSASVMYEPQTDAAVLICSAAAPGGATVNLQCGDSPGVAMVSTSTAVAPWLPGQLPAAQVSATAYGAYNVFKPLSASFTINW